MRLDWDTYFLGVAESVAARTDCLRGKVGAVLVDRDRRIVSTGYPGVPPGELGCLSGGCLRGQLSFEEVPSGMGYELCPPTHRHAERNCLEWANDVDRINSWMYITRPPCSECSAMLLLDGIARIVYPGGEIEIWHQVAENSFYEVSNLGNVRSWKTRGSHSGTIASSPRILIPRPQKRYPYLRFTICDGSGKNVDKKIHHAVLEAFGFPRPTPESECAHANDIATDNRLVNLRWTDRVGNWNDRSAKVKRDNGRFC